MSTYYAKLNAAGDIEIIYFFPQEDNSLTEVDSSSELYKTYYNSLPDVIKWMQPEPD